MRTCNNCEFLSITEQEQNGIKRDCGKTVPHTCLKYGKKVTHAPFIHPIIHPCKECIVESEGAE